MGIRAPAIKGARPQGARAGGSAVWGRGQHLFSQGRTSGIGGNRGVGERRCGHRGTINDRGSRGEQGPDVPFLMTPVR